MEMEAPQSKAPEDYRAATEIPDDVKGSLEMLKQVEAERVKAEEAAKDTPEA